MTAFALLLVGVSIILVYLFWLAPGSLTIVSKIVVGNQQRQVGATIAVNGHRLPQSTGKIRLGAGYYRITISRSHYQSENFMVKIAPGEDKVMEKQLVHEKGHITLTANLPEIQASFFPKDDRPSFTLLIPIHDYAIDTGDYRVEFTRQNYFPWQQDIRVDKNRNMELAVKLRPMVLWRADLSQQPKIRDIALADIDRDGEPDFFYVDDSGSISCCALERSKPYWSGERQLPCQWRIKKRLTPGTSPLGIADVTRDGVPDIIAGHNFNFMVFDGLTRKEIFRLPNWWGRHYLLVDVNRDNYRDLILLTNYSGIHCYDLRSGKMLWRTPKGRHAMSYPVVVDNLQMIYADRSQLWQLDLASGRQHKFFKCPGDQEPGNIIKAILPGSNRQVLMWYIQSQGLYCMEYQTKRLVWRKKINCQHGSSKLLLYDIDNDGHQEILLHLDKLHCLDPVNGDSKWSTDFEDNNPPSHMPLVGDLDGDGKVEIIAIRGRTICTMSNNGKIRSRFAAPKPITRALMVDSDGDGRLDIVAAAGNLIYCLYPLPDRRLRFLDINDNRPESLPLAVELSGDRYQELVAGNNNILLCLDGKTWRPRWAGSLPGWIANPPAAVDIDGDGRPEIVVHAGNNIVLLNGDGREIWSSHLEYQGNLKPPLVADCNRDGIAEILVTANNFAPLCLDSKSGRILWHARQPMSTTSFFEVADLDGDGYPELVASAHNSVLADGVRTNFVFCYSCKDGALKWIGRVPSHNEGGGVLLGDADGDGKCEVFVKQVSGYLSCLDGRTGHGRWHTKYHGGCFNSGAMLHDIDGDGRVDLIVGNRNGRILCIDPLTGHEKWRRSTGENLAVGLSVYMQPLDLDGDRVADIVTTGFDHSLYFIRGKDGSRMGEFGNFGFIGKPFLLKDLDGDRSPDLLFCDQDSRLICIYDLAGHFRRMTAPKPKVRSETQYGQTLALARLNQLLHRDDYRRLEKEIGLYAERLKDWNYLLDFYRGICALERQQNGRALEAFQRCEQSPAKVFDNRFLLAVAYLDAGNPRAAYPLLLNLLQTSVLEFERCYDQYRSLVRKPIALRKMLIVAVKKTHADRKLVGLYQNALVLNDPAQAGNYLGLSLKYGVTTNPGYQKRYRNYLKAVLAEADQHKSSYTYHRSLDILDEALRIIPESLELRLVRGRRYLEDDLPLDQARQDFETVLIQRPEDVEAWMNKILVLAREGKTAPAVEELKSLRQKHPAKPQSAEDYLYRILAAILAGQKKIAAENYALLRSRFADYLAKRHYLQMAIYRLSKQ